MPIRSAGRRSSTTGGSSRVWLAPGTVAERRHPQSRGFTTNKGNVPSVDILLSSKRCPSSGTCSVALLCRTPRHPLSTSALALAVLLAVWGCDRPTPRSSTTPAAVGHPDSVLVDSTKAALRRFRASNRPSSADSAALLRWGRSLQVRGDSIRTERPTRARNLYGTALSSHRTLTDSLGVLQTRKAIGKTYDLQSRYEDARDQYENALQLSRALEAQGEIIDHLQSIGETFEEQGHHSQALRYYREALSVSRKAEHRGDRAKLLDDLGDVYVIQGRYDQALEQYRASLALERDRDDRGRAANMLTNLGNIHYRRGHYEKTLARYKEALSIQRTIGNREDIGTTLNNIGVVNLRQGRYREAMAQYREALEIRREVGDQKGVASTLNNIGLAYQRQGRYKQALDRYREALKIKREVGDQRGTASTLNNIGLIQKKWGRYEKALGRYQESLALKRKFGNREAMARTLNNIGLVRMEQERYDEALARLRASLRIRRDIENRRGIARSLNSVGRVYERRDNLDAALQQYRRALQINREVGNRDGTAQNLRNVGESRLLQGRVAAAADTLTKAVHLTETLRRNATSPDARRSFLSTQIGAYRALTSAHVRSGRPDSALRSLERARARLLADRLAGTARGDTTFTIPSIPELRRTLDPGEAALLYTNAGTKWPLTVLAVTADTTVALELPVAPLRRVVRQAYAPRLERLRREKGPLTAALGPDRTGADGRSPSVAEIVRLYRYYLTRDGTDSTQQDLARRLHALLVAPVEKALPSEETFTVIPTGALGYLPFETLRDSTNQPVVQQKHVRYAQSLTVLHQLRERTYDAQRKSLLAIGGAAYGASAPDREQPLLAAAQRGSPIVNAEQASALYRSAERRLERGQSPRPTYAQLGYDQWPALYGTKLEVQKLKRAVGPATTLQTGLDASEKRVRRMSASGALSRYRRIHFATHGIAVPEAPQLSALVLSQKEASDSLAARDGYLTMREIADLTLRADVAVLSACRTGLGRIVAGEGVVSLSHAFLRAGTNATLVSQWRVLDWSTQQFMTAVYRRAENEHTSFAEAVTEVKRAFIAGKFGERNTDPLRWAPFVYYGRE